MNKPLIITGAVTLLFLSILTIIFKNELLPIIKWGAIGIVGVALIGGVIVAGVWIYIAVERAWIVQAQRKAAQRDSEVLVVTTQDGQVHIRETNHKVDWRAAHVDQRVYANSKATYAPPEPHETDAWRWWNQPKTKTQVIEGQYQLTSGEQAQPSFYDVIASYPHLMLIAPTGSGKTTQLAFAVDYRCKQYPGAAVVWLSTHAGLDTNIIPSNAVTFNHREDIGRVLADLFVTYQKRRDTGKVGRQIIICLDEWPELVDELRDLEIKAGDYLRRMSRGGRKTGFSLIMASHGGTVNDLDTAGHSSVKQDFAQVLLDSGLTKQGKAIWQQFDKKSSQIEIVLPQLVEVNLTDSERLALELWNKSDHTDKAKNKIADLVYGHGGYQRQRVDNLIQKYSK